MQIEPLKDIQEYLQRTANDLEQVSMNLAGHVMYLQHTFRPTEMQEVSAKIEGLQASVQDLRGVVRLIDQTSPNP
ncbi:hypothetical protein K5D56_00075 [Pseudomonas cichorii]|uniref:Uncharacterized protein n=1 Tax=Pseudomonas lijiangensis TaxID=2995658 RepID=A0ABX8HXH7_9PSED|nr:MULTISPECIES: hypothetical protein [Pseudomonas syringae group]MBX8492814.1 hypothetical protein [Pseudomonas cichorii]MBX8501826.1 hypothetical protein [Pseudomonas lijiangensis]MBX8506661.1 hypothetical protein [Pseudomonas lijiangensis]MBX8518544.1 hypothetical protein [Pseudomonas cichorii]MBX8542817.1 hypothetical protein [Pseudomonas cichorii]